MCRLYQYMSLYIYILKQFASLVFTQMITFTTTSRGNRVSSKRAQPHYLVPPPCIEAKCIPATPFSSPMTSLFSSNETRSRQVDVVRLILKLRPKESKYKVVQIRFNR